jgi:hypothetical protein
VDRAVLKKRTEQIYRKKEDKIEEPADIRINNKLVETYRTINEM